MSARNISASVRDRLLNKARAEELDYNLLLTAERTAGSLASFANRHEP